MNILRKDKVNKSTPKKYFYIPLGIIRFLSHPIDSFAVGKFIKRYLELDDVFFVQVGANDGVNDDPINKYIHTYHWNGLLVEPSLRHFENLKKNYADEPQLRFEHAAIGKSNGTAILYGVSPKAPWFTRTMGSSLNSFDKNVILKHPYPKLEKFIIEETVKIVSLSSLLERHHISKIDLLLIDIEGYDYEALKQFNFAVQPKLIVFENKHLCYTDKIASEQYLEDRGYIVERRSKNTLAVLKSLVTQ